MIDFHLAAATNKSTMLLDCTNASYLANILNVKSLDAAVVKD